MLWTVVMETETSTEFIDNQYDELIPISTDYQQIPRITSRHL